MAARAMLTRSAKAPREGYFAVIGQRSGRETSGMQQNQQDGRETLQSSPGLDPC
jgi:hypothetical protein